MKQTTQQLTQEIFYSVDHIEQHHEQKKSIAKSFFNKKNLRPFKSKVLQDVYQGAGGIFFVVSSQNPHDGKPRFFAVKEYNPQTGSIHEPANAERESLHRFYDKNECIQEAKDFAAGNIKRLGAE